MKKEKNPPMLTGQHKELIVLLAQDKLRSWDRAGHAAELMFPAESGYRGYVTKLVRDLEKHNYVKLSNKSNFYITPEGIDFYSREIIKVSR